MVIKLNRRATDDEVRDLREILKREGLEGRLIEGTDEKIIAVIGDESRKLEFLEGLRNLPYVASFTPVSNTPTDKAILGSESSLNLANSSVYL